MQASPGMWTLHYGIRRDGKPSCGDEREYSSGRAAEDAVNSAQETHGRTGCTIWFARLYDDQGNITNLV